MRIMYDGTSTYTLYTGFSCEPARTLSLSLIHDNECRKKNGGIGFEYENSGIGIN